MAAMDLPQRPLERPLPATASPTERQPLHARALYQDVAERLRQKIFNREIEPGGWIDEQRIAAEYGIDRVIKEIDKNMKELEEDKPAIPPLTMQAPKELE